MSGITSHVLDTSRGVPGEGIPVILQINRGSSDDTRWKVVGQGKTDADGRVPDLVAGKFETGHYRISFHVAEYFEGLGQETFYPVIKIVFKVSADEHYHVPLLLNAFGYSTYRCS